MNLQLAFLITVLAIVSETSANCGCLKCSKDLQIISPPHYPYKIIVKAPMPERLPLQPLSYIPPLDVYKATCPPVYAYKYKMQIPLDAVPLPPLPTVTKYVAAPDRVVIQNTDCPSYIEDGACVDPLLPPPAPILPPVLPGSCCPSPYQFYPAPLSTSLFSPSLLSPAASLPVRSPGPILEPITSNTFKCECRYEHRRKKRDLPILRHSVKFLVRLLPRFIRVPIERFLWESVAKPPETLGRLQRRPETFLGMYRSPVEMLHRPSVLGRFQQPATFLEKLQTVNRAKRAVTLDAQEMRLPFFRVTEVENDREDESEEDEYVGRAPRNEYLEPLNFNQLFPHNPIFYILNAPIRILRHFHRLGQQISPVFKSVPHVLVNSRRYLRNLGKDLKNDFLSVTSDLIGDFDGLETPHYVRPRRYRRSLLYEPDYSLAFNNQSESHRTKRYILKVVDEDEVEEFLREKLGGFTEAPPKKKEKEGKKKLVVEPLSSKVIIDNNGRPFVEINGVKRPLFLNRKKNADTDDDTKSKIKPFLLRRKPQPPPPPPPPPPQSEEEDIDVKDKISSLILKARQRLEENAPIVGSQQNVPNQMIKDRINHILTEVQDLINIDFDEYSTIHGDLRKLESFKELLVAEWKKILMENKANDISTKIQLLGDFQELQILRDKAVLDIASLLFSGPSFMTKKLIKILVRLQKLQCVIYRVVEDFDERIKVGTDFDDRKEIKYVDYLAGLHFGVGRTKQDLEDDLRSERDAALENEIKVLESLRKLLEESQDNPQKLYEEAQLLWEIKNIDKLQKDTMEEMNEKISRGQKVRKELKILFDLLRQLENCEEKQKKLLEIEKKSEVEVPKIEEIVESTSPKTKIPKRKIRIPRILTNRNRRFPHKTFVEDKKPIRLVSNGHIMTAYKVSDGFD